MFELLYFLIGLIIGAFIVFVWHTVSYNYRLKLQLLFKIDDLESELEEQKSFNELLRKELIKNNKS